MSDHMYDIEGGPESRSAKSANLRALLLTLEVKGPVQVTAEELSA